MKFRETLARLLYGRYGADALYNTPVGRFHRADNQPVCEQMHGVPPLFCCFYDSIFAFCTQGGIDKPDVCAVI